MQTQDSISLWHDLVDRPRRYGSAENDVSVDVAIVGGGFTGLWTAYFLKTLAPQLSIAILESEHVGFGASGRNGGWLMGALEGLDYYLEGLSSAQKKSTYSLVHGIPAAVKRVLEKEQIVCDFQHGGGVYAAARYREQIAHLQEDLRHLHDSGTTEQDYRWLDEVELQEQMRIANGYGALYTPHIAAIQPAKLVFGLAEVVTRMGVTIYENSPIVEIKQGQARTAAATIKADTVVSALEGYHHGLRGGAGYILPLQSLIVATEPLAESQWDDIGLHERQVFCDGSRLSTYGQRTADGRLVFGSRGSYDFGGKVINHFDSADPQFELRRSLAVELLPGLKGCEFTHAWGGTLGFSRRSAPHVIYDEVAGFATAGGYGGEGVGASHLLGHTLAETILGVESERTQQPWVFTQPIKKAIRRWEPEPLRWLAYKSIYTACDWEERVLSDPTTPAWQRSLSTLAASTLYRLVS